MTTPTCTCAKPKVITSSMERVLGSFCGACGLPLLKEVKCCEKCKGDSDMGFGMVERCWKRDCPCHSPNKTECGIPSVPIDEAPNTEM